MKKLKTILTLLLITIVISGTMAQTSQEYTVDEIADFQTDLAAGTYDIYILTTSGGVYDLTEYVTITSDVVIRAADGLAEKPVIQRTNNTGGGAGIFLTAATTVNISLDGLIFDGTVTGDNKIVAFRAESTAHFYVDNCVFRNFTETNGVFRLQGENSSIDLRNSVFHDISQRVIQPWEVNITYGHINIDNCLFYDINGPIVWFRSTGGGANLAQGTTLTVNHSTFHNINTNFDGVFRGRDNNTGETLILNSVFTEIADNRPITRGFNNTLVDYSYYDGDNAPHGDDNATVTNIFTTTPEYSDADALNFEITEPDDFITGTGDVAGVVWYYPPRVLPELLVDGTTQMRVVFSRPMNEASAETVTNYTLSGTFGLTGSPSEAALDSDREVLLTVSDITDADPGETIIVTVSGVEDIYGIAVAGNNIATYEKSGFPVTFTVTFDDNGTSVPIEGAEITIDDVAGTLTTDADGKAVIVLENGTYTFSVEAVDYATQSGETFTVNDEALAVPVTMSPIPFPTLTMNPQEVNNRPGQFVTGTSDKTGFIVIVKSDVPQSTLAEIMAAIDANLAASADVTVPGVNVNISTEGLQPGVYNGYAVDANEVISDPIVEVVTVYDSQGREYTVEQIEQFQTDLAAGAYDAYILSTSGGIYDLSSYVTITTDVVIKAAAGLAEKPVIQRTNNTGGGAGIFLTQTNTVNIGLEGLIFDGTVTGGNKVVAFRAESTAHFDVDNCVFRNFTETNGVFRLHGENSTVDVRNSTFHDNSERMIHFWQTNTAYGHVNIDNCLFYNINGSIVFTRIVSGVAAIPSSLTVNHSTFHNIAPGNNGVFRGRNNNATGETHILNSVFTDIDAALTVDIPDVTVDYSYVATLDPVPEGTNLITITPVYEDAENFNFTITNEDDLIAGTGDVAGVVWYYPPRVLPNLLIESDTQLKVVFSRPMDETSATTATNYTLSGTSGFTGNPSAAVLADDRTVVLTVDDISGISVNETIVVTVSGVEDTYGIQVGDKNEATYIKSGYLVTFTVTFDNDGTPTPIEGAEISINGINGTLTTNASGVASIELENGSYTYGVEAIEFIPLEDQSFVVNDEPVPVDVTLEPIPQPTLTMEQQEVSNRDNQTVTGSSDKSGFIVIIKNDAPQATLAEIEAAINDNLAASADVATPGESVSISTGGLQPGIYNGYAVDANDAISDVVSDIVTINDPATREYTVDQLAQFEADLTSAAYDEYVLATSGGIYDLTNYISIRANTIIKGAEGLAEKPVISRTNNTSTFSGILRVNNLIDPASTAIITLENLILDGTVDSDNADHLTAGIRADATVHIDASNSVFRNITNINGVFRLQGANSSIDVRNSVFHDNADRLIQLFTPNVEYGHINIDNCVFYNINGSIVFYRTLSGENAIGTTLTVKHSTFHNIDAGSDGLFRGRNNATGQSQILNSVFTNISAGTPLANGLPDLAVDYCYVEGMDTEVGWTNLFTAEPEYEDAENNNFRITNADDFLVASGDIAGVVWYYPPRVNPGLLIANDTQVKVVFNRPVEVASAENVANYELSGTFGLTGNPTEATLTNQREVLLTVDDVSDVPDGETIIVTVTNVEDTFGMTIEDNNIATYTGSTAADPEEYLVTFTVTFDDDGTPAPVEGAEITITGIEGPLTTDADGAATIELENGTYTYSVIAAGFVSLEDETFEVEDGPEDVAVTLELIFVPGEPTLTMDPQEVSNREGQIVTGSSDKSGFIAIIRQDAPQSDLTEILEAIETDLGSSAEVTTVGEPVSISTGGLQPGIYNGYAVDLGDVISEPVLAVVTVNDFHSREYPVDEIEQLQTDLSSGAYDEYILITSGGVYDLTNYVTLKTDVVLKAAEGLAEKPVLMRTSNTGVGAGMFRVQDETVHITLKGLIFDGTVTGDNKIVAFRAESTAHFNVDHSVFRNFTEQHGVFRMQGENSSVDVRNSVFHDNWQRIIHLFQTEVSFGDVNIDNCLFYNIDGPVVFTRIVGGVPAIGASITVNHSTFDNITAGTDGIFRGRQDNATGPTTILNSVFTNIPAGTPLATQFPDLTVDYSYVEDMDTGADWTNLFTIAPVYEDTENNIFRITNADDFLVASGDIAGVTWYYPPRVSPELRYVNATQVRVVFNRPVDPATSVITTNYALSGTFGLTGNPSAALLSSNNREVTLTIENIANVSIGETVIVTVTGVEDTYGTVIEGNNVATFTGDGEVLPDIYLVTFTVTFDNGGTPTPIQGAQITIEGIEETLTTNAAGVATIELENGTYTYDVEADGYISLTGASFEVEDGPANVDVALEQVPLPDTYLATFTVNFDDEGTLAPVEGAQITITDVEEGPLTTNTAGVATIELENGTYTYNLVAAGFVSVADASFVVEDGPVDIDVILEPVTMPDAPTLTMAPQEVSNREGQAVSGSSDKPGFIAIIRQDAPQSGLTEILAAIETDLGSSAVVTSADEMVSISTGGLQPGIYNGYAVDMDDVVSDPVVAVVTVNDFHSREYPVEEIAQLQTDLSTGAYDEYILITSGGVYDLTSYVTIRSDLALKAAEGLAEKPVLSRTNNTGVGAGMFRTQDETVHITLNGLIFDGTVTGENKIVAFRAESTAHFIVNHSVFRNFTEQNGVFRLHGENSSMDVSNSVFHDSWQRIIHFFQPEVTYGHVNIDNCLFYDIEGPILFTRIVGGVPAIGTSLTVNHSTFDNISVANPNDGVFTGRQNNATGETIILNSVFTNISQDTPLATQFPEVIVDYSYLENMPTGPDWTNLLTTVPVYEDPENKIFRITNADDFLVASGDIAGVTWYYPPRVHPDLLIASNNQIKVIFNRPVEETSAQNTANYTLSGTFGITGHPSSVRLENEREALLTVGDVSSIPQGQTIIVTVTDVADTNGLVIEDNNVATFEQPVEVDLEVFVEGQTVSNAQGQFVVVQSSLPEGFVYIVLEGEPQQTKEQLDAAVAAGKGAFSVVTEAMTDTEISTFNLHPGTYLAYAVSTAGQLSAPGTNTIEITDGIPPVVTNEAQTATNGPDDFVLVQSNKDNGHVYIIIAGHEVSTQADLDAAVADNQGRFAEVTAANTDIQVSTSGLEPSFYFAYATDAAGNISQRGTVPITIIPADDDTSAEDIFADQLRVFSANRIIYIKAPSSLHGIGYELFDINGRMVNAGRLNDDTQVNIDNPGVYFVRVLNGQNLPIKVLVSW